PSPHRQPTSSVHIAEQPSQLVVLPSSHSSPAPTFPLPHTAGVQFVSQWPGVPLRSPSSHCSPGSRMPSPHAGMRWHVVSHRPGTGGSHSSPHVVFTSPSPQRSPVSTRQPEEQPSQSARLPSSHSSVPQTAPSPQPVSMRQCALHPSQSVTFPSSHSS